MFSDYFFFVSNSNFIKEAHMNIYVYMDTYFVYNYVLCL